jgi:hypothetical protein
MGRDQAQSDDEDPSEGVDEVVVRGRDNCQRGCQWVEQCGEPPLAAGDGDDGNGTPERPSDMQAGQGGVEIDEAGCSAGSTSGIEKVVGNQRVAEAQARQPRWGDRVEPVDGERAEAGDDESGTQCRVRGWPGSPQQHQKCGRDNEVQGAVVVAGDQAEMRVHAEEHVEGTFRIEVGRPFNRVDGGRVVRRQPAAGWSGGSGGLVEPVSDADCADFCPPGQSPPAQRVALAADGDSHGLTSSMVPVV